MGGVLLQEFFLCVLLLTWTTYVNLSPAEPYDIIEFFSGRSKIARYGQSVGYKAAALDIVFDSVLRAETPNPARMTSAFDINSDAGLALLF